MIQKNEVLLKDGETWRYFSNPEKIISTAQLNDVREAMREVERLVNERDLHAAGFVSYEAAPAFDGHLHALASTEFPLIWFGLYAEPQTVKLPQPNGAFQALNWQATTEREIYNTAIEKIKEYIAEGRTYQVNYTMRLRADFITDEWNFFYHLVHEQNKYAAFVDTGRYVICSASPELFFELDNDELMSRPMKGTVKRGRTTAEDKAQIGWLENSIKNRAENVMIVDMIRNDFGKIAQVGSVHVPKLFEIETYPTLFQMSSTIRAKTKSSITEIFQALFPCASITGAPKVSTMKIISELEPTPRNIYTGSIGFISPHRKAKFNVAIRTAIIDKEKQIAEYGVGGGIVWDSESGDEYNEAILKARVLSKPYQEFSLLETILWTPSEGYFLLDKHLARMADSANYFNFPFLEGELINLLNETKANFTSPQRLRVLLSSSGQFKIEAVEFTNEKRAFKAKLATKAINSSSPFYFHKTTYREFYPHEVGFDDFLLYNENDELTEFTIGNLVLELDGKLFTPPISCGLLAGTFRSHLLETGQIEERILMKDDLKRGTKIFLINSLRKWVQVEI